MNALGILVFLFQFPFFEACLIIHTAECSCPHFEVGRQNIELVSNNDYYSKLIELPIQAPRVSGNNCSLTMSCHSPNYRLVLMNMYIHVDLEGKNAEAICDRTFNTFIVNTNMEFHQLFGVCVNFEPDAPMCTPEDQTTVFLAYSADIAREDIASHLEGFTQNYWYVAPMMYNFAFVRFDLPNERNIEYQPNWEKWVSAMNRSLVNTPVPYPPLNESDAIRVIERFLSNTVAPICGSRIIMVMKHPFPQVNTQELVAKLRKNRISLYTVSPWTQNRNSELITNIASQTDGYGVITERFDANFDFFYSLPYFESYFCVYAANMKMMPGSVSIPDMKIPASVAYHFVISGTSKLEGTNTVKLSWKSADDSGSMSPGDQDLKAEYNTLRRQYVYLTEGVYQMSLEYTGSFPYETFILRVYSQEMINYWVPYDYVPTL